MKASSKSSSPSLYLYAIVDGRRSSSPTTSSRASKPAVLALGKGVMRRPLMLVRAGGAWVVVEPQTDTPEATPEMIVAQDRVVQRISRTFSATLPMRFGSLVANKTSLEELLSPLSHAIELALDRVRGCVQFTLRVTGRALKMPTPMKKLGPGAKWLAQRIAEQRVPEIEPLTIATRPFVREARIVREARDVRAARSARGKQPLLARAYHLVRREDLRAWRAAMRRSLAELDTEVHVTMTGPWPPYAFAELT